MMNITKEILERTPLMKPEYLPMYLKLKEHDHAPNWNYVCGDRLNEEDMIFINDFKRKLNSNRKERKIEPEDEFINWISTMSERVILFKEKTKNLKIKKDYNLIIPMVREDISTKLEKIIPTDESLNRIIVNPTSGTTGHPILAVNHPKSIGCYNPMLYFALEKHGIHPPIGYENVACILVCAQKETACYSTVHSDLEGAGFAKINLHPSVWKTAESPGIYIKDMNPGFLTGDPFSFSELLKLKLDFKPKALISTATELTDSLRIALENEYNCPIINLYSSNETGLIAYSCPIHKDSMHILPHDIHIEILDENNYPVMPGVSGEIAITGGRNPFLPLLRYKTGDRAILDFSSCECKDPMPILKELQTRKLVIFEDKDKNTVNPVDISRILRRYPILQHRMVQKKDLTLILQVKTFDNYKISNEEKLKIEILSLFQNPPEIEVRYDLDMERKFLTYERE